MLVYKFLCFTTQDFLGNFTGRGSFSSAFGVVRLVLKSKQMVYPLGRQEPRPQQHEMEGTGRVPLRAAAMPL